MIKRKSITTRTRFEIFKRDCFTCLYCGNHPPAVVLHVDHIVPVSKGGGCESENLATSCQSCNLGKSDVPLGNVSPSIKDTISVEVERVKQMRLYNKWLLEIKNAKDKDFRIVSDAMLTAEGEDCSKFVAAGNKAATIRALLKRLPYVEILEAIEIANSKFSFEYSQYKTFKYFCGICWRKVSIAEGRSV